MKFTIRTPRLFRRFSRSPVPGPFRPRWVRSPGFTVVELSVVLIVIGLLVGGVLKLEQVYRNYKIRQVVNQYRELSVAVKVYRDKYGYWPGDDPRADVHVGVVATHIGTGDERIEDTGAPQWQMEYYLAFEHLARAGLLTGSYNGTSNYLKHTFNNSTIFITNYIESTSVRRTHIRFTLLSPDVAQAVDSALDDSDPTRGLVRAYTGSMVGSYYILTPITNYNSASTIPFTAIAVE